MGLGDTTGGSLEAWVVGVVAAGIVAALGWLLKTDRDRIAADARSALDLAQRVDKELAVVQEGNKAILDRLNGLEDGQQEILRILRR